MSAIETLTFEPVYQQYIWGGRNLETVLGKRLPTEDGIYAESWEIVDHKDGQSVVKEGELKGWPLSRVVAERGADLLGKHHPQEKFPLLFKFLDCQANLSVQVHPNDAQGAKLHPPDLGKTEAWVILAAQPGSRLYAGLKEGVDRETLESKLREGTAEDCLHVIEPAVGDCIFIPAGTVHALAEGLVVAEIQQSSNTTYRLYDWNRVDAEGNSRQLDIERGVGVTDFERGPVDPQTPCRIDDQRERLVTCDKFVLDRVTPSASSEFATDETCHILAVLEGSVEIGSTRISKGETAILPASCQKARMTADSNTTLLDMFLP